MGKDIEFRKFIIRVWKYDIDHLGVFSDKRRKRLQKFMKELEDLK